MSTVNFSKKTIENLEVSCDDMKEIKFEFLDDTLRLSIVKENDKEVIEEIIYRKEEMEDDEVVKEEPTEDVIEEKVIEKLAIDDLKKIIYETIPKKNTAETYFRSVKQVYDNFKDDDVYDLLKKKMKLLNILKQNMTNCQLLRTNFVAC